jgi:hypothetical protein
MKTKDTYKAPEMELDNQFMLQIILAASLSGVSINDAEEVNWG